MGFSRALRGLGGAALAGALVVGTAPAAHADEARKTQWALSAYQASKVVWPHTTGKGVTVAVIDSGVNAGHVDLSGQVLPGKDFTFGGDAHTDHSTDSHGTVVASIIAAHGHGPNGEDGIMGLAPGAKILPVGVGPGDGAPGTDYTAQAIRYAVDHGAQVINMSIAGPSNTLDLQSAVAYAEQHNVVLVAGAGNNGFSDPLYPASEPGVIKVGAVDKSGKLWSQSNTGGITVVAPGVGILGDGADSSTGYRIGDGTSFATAYVSAIAALYRSEHPSLTAGQIVNYVIKTAILPKGLTAPDSRFGYGIASPDPTMAVDAGPAAGPLPQATDPLKQTAGATPGSSTTASGSGSSSATIAIVLGALGGLVVLVVIILVVARNRRGGGGGGANGGGGTGYPQGRQPYQPQPAYQPPTGQYGQNPYAGQQNPYGGTPDQQFPPQQGYGGGQGR